MRRRKGTGDEAKEVALDANPAGPLCAQVFKVVSDPYVGKVSYLRVLQRTLPADSAARMGDDRRETKFGQMLRIQGKTP